MTSKKNEMRLSSLQVALLTILQQAGDKPVALALLAKQVYKRAGKRKAKTASQSIAALVLGTDLKLKRISASITRSTPIGRGNEAEYCLRGNINNVEECLAFNAERERK